MTNKELPLSRRSFLKGSGSVIIGTLAMTSGSIALLAPSRTWALELNSLNDHTGKTLLQFCRHLYPHSDLEDAVYALIVKDLDAAAAGDSGVQTLLQSGVQELDSAAGGDWLSLGNNNQFLYVDSLQGTPFFEKLRSTAVVSLYNNEMAFAHFGYEGEKGSAGYLHRGFDDLSWLPDPPDDASGPMPDASA